MFSQLTLPTETEITAQDITQLVMAEAIAHIAQLTGLAQNACEKLVKQQLIGSTETKAPASNVNDIITHHETDFIGQLFKEN
ncbi:hypothetical protein [Thalassotalea sp. PLHSN55]|uniref:hypothetical protein n=1 Tax=Thalassotalea sp. PLHSN55 TaxID=3435888 RepID=UPI003F82E989